MYKTIIYIILCIVTFFMYINDYLHVHVAQ